MPTLEDDDLIFRFPSIEPDAQFSISFMRTLRIPDTEQTYFLPPGFGTFPLRHVEDYAKNLPAHTLDRGGVIMPMWQAEAMWMNFDNDGPEWSDGNSMETGFGLPVAVKIAAGKINAVSGESWRPGLHRDPQDYVVSPSQPWLDGFAIEKGVIRQFVAMPLGDGYSVEEQLTQTSEWGGVQISVTPLKASVWKRIKEASGPAMLMDACLSRCCESFEMGLGAGGRMHQQIYEDAFNLEDWDWDATERVFVSLIHAKDWKAVTGEAAQNEPPTAKDYTEAGLPWFDYYAKDLVALSGSAALAGVKSIAEVFADKTGAQLVGSSDITIGKPVTLARDLPGPRPVRSSSSW